MFHVRFGTSCRSIKALLWLHVELHVELEASSNIKLKPVLKFVSE